MIFDESTVCAPVFCRELNRPGRTVLPQAPFVIVLTSSGIAEISAGRPAQLLRAGELFLCGHAGIQVQIFTEGHVLAAGFSGFAAETAAGGLVQPISCDCAACPAAAQLLGELSGAMQRGGSAGLSALCYRILCETVSADSAEPRLSPLVSDAVLAIRENYAGLYGVEELSNQLGVSKSHLVRVFSAEMGMGPGRYLTEVRIEAAKTLLARREYSLEVVATLSGFSGANYLCRVFKKQTGETPAAWRAQHADTLRSAALNDFEDALYT